MISKCCLNLFLCCYFLNGISQELRAPAYPLVTHNPYQSIWSMGDTLNTSATQHWTGKEQGLVGLIAVDGVVYRFLGVLPKNYRSVLTTADEENYSVRYSHVRPSSKWVSVNFDDSSWKIGQAPFSDDASQPGTTWKGSELWVRRTFDLGGIDLSDLYLKLRHDDNVNVYLNGEKIYGFEGWEDQYKYIPIENSVHKKLKNKDNVLAVHIKNTAGGALLDAGLVSEVKLPELDAIKTAEQTQVELKATRTIYTFDCGNIELTATFTSPLLLDNVDLLGRPVTYLSVKSSPKDKMEHDVKLYLGVSTSLAVNDSSQKVIANQYKDNGMAILKAGTTEQPILQKKGDDLRIDWGQAYVATADYTGVAQYVSSQIKAIPFFVDPKKVEITKDKRGTDLVLNTVVDLGKTKEIMKEQVFLLAYDERYSVDYFGKKLQPWWKKENNLEIEELLAKSFNEYEAIDKNCRAFDEQLYKEALAVGGKKYADLCVLSYRQAIAAHTLLEAPNGELLFLSKENNSNGSINTVDVTYPSAPLFLIYNPDLLKGMLNGIFDYSESGRWEKPFPAHDLGTYPIAHGQTYGEDMPVEESGNMIILTAATVMREGNIEYAKKHWASLTKWANYLMKNGFDPANQLSTDDFAGHLARNANLSIKAIIALGCYGKLATMMGDKKTGRFFDRAARNMAKKWMELAYDKDHYTLAFGKKGTWSQKYNLAWDTILGLNIFPDSVRKKEIDYYLTKQNVYGLPLDSRKNYTKSDWVLWTATMTDNEKDFGLFIDPIWKYADETPDRVPLSDWHDTDNAHVISFKARSVVGGYFMKLLKEKMAR